MDKPEITTEADRASDQRGVDRGDSMHTKGPWGVERTQTDNWIGPMRPDGKVRDVLFDNDRDGLRREALVRNDANAHLIAAAPEMYEALRQLRGHLDGTTGEIDALDVVNRAIAKAEGK